MAATSNADAIWTMVEGHSPDLCAMSDEIWETPELNYQEVKSVARHKDMLAQKGFRISENLGGDSHCCDGRSGRRRPGDCHSGRI